MKLIALTKANFYQILEIFPRHTDKRFNLTTLSIFPSLRTLHSFNGFSAVIYQLFKPPEPSIQASVNENMFVGFTQRGMLI